METDEHFLPIIEEGQEPDLGNDDSVVDEQAALEKKYGDQMRQIMPQKIELPISTLPAMIKEQIDLSPHFQRRGRWDVARQSRFIESIIMNVPIPPVFLGEDQYGQYVVLDGRQRLTAINEFLKNNYKLKGLKIWSELNGESFNGLLSRKLDRYLMRRFIPAVVILKESSSEVKYDVFDRLNTGAVMAEPMEIRNAVFQGKFNELVRKLSDQPGFRRLWDIPTDDIKRENNATYSKMVDLELVLRFFALREPAEIKAKFKDYLSDYMNDRNALYLKSPEIATEDEKQFNWAIRNCLKIFGDDAFKRSSTGTRSAPLADAYMVALANINPETLTKEQSVAIRSSLNKIATKDADFLKAFGTGTNGKGAITIRVEKARAAVQNALRA